MLQTPYTETVVEQARLACLRNLKILDTAADERIDRVTAMASVHYGVPIALISLLDDQRQWFKSRVGLDALETPRCVAFCDYTIRQPNVFIVENAAKDDRFAGNPLVTSDPNIRFYAGAPITIDEEHRIGTLCLIASIYQSRDTLSTLSDLKLHDDQADAL